MTRLACSTARRQRAADSFSAAKVDGLVKSPIYVVVGLARQFAVPYVLPNCRARHYASYIELFSEPILSGKLTFYEIIKVDGLVKT